MTLTLLDTRLRLEGTSAVTSLYDSVGGASGLVGQVIIGSLVGLTRGFTAALAALAFDGDGGRRG